MSRRIAFDSLTGVVSAVDADPMELDPDAYSSEPLTTLVDCLTNDHVAGIPFAADHISADDVPCPWKPDIEVGFTGPFAWGSVDARTVAGIQAVIAHTKWGQSPAQFLRNTDDARLSRLLSVLAGDDDPDRGGIPPVVILIGSDGRVLPWQEGRHRSVAAIQAGVRQMPVKFVLDTDQPGEVPAEADLPPSE